MGTVTAPRNATRAQLRSLGGLMDKHRRRGVTLVRVADRIDRSIGYLSEITRGLLPKGRRVSLDEYERIKRAILDIAGVSR